jgi:hypothetical protein
VRPEGLGELEQLIHFNGYRTGDLPAFIAAGHGKTVHAQPMQSVELLSALIRKVHRSNLETNNSKTGEFFSLPEQSLLFIQTSVLFTSITSESTARKPRLISRRILLIALSSIKRTRVYALSFRSFLRRTIQIDSSHSPI